MQLAVVLGVRDLDRRAFKLGPGRAHEILQNDMVFGGQQGRRLVPKTKLDVRPKQAELAAK